MAKGSKPANPGKGQGKITAGKSDSGGKVRTFAPFLATASPQARRKETAEKVRVKQAKNQGKK